MVLELDRTDLGDLDPLVHRLRSDLALFGPRLGDELAVVVYVGLAVEKVGLVDEHHVDLPTFGLDDVVVEALVRVDVAGPENLAFAFDHEPSGR